MSSSSASSSPSSSRTATPEPRATKPKKSTLRAAAAAIPSSRLKRKAQEPQSDSDDDNDDDDDADSAADSDSNAGGGSDSSENEDEDEDEDEVRGSKSKMMDSSDNENDDNDANTPPPPTDEPVLSHAERRKRKKEAKKLAAAASSSSTTPTGPPSKKQKLADGSSKPTKPTGQQPRKNSVWVGNLSFKTTPESLKAFFKDVQGQVTRVHMPMKAPAKPGLKPENRGFAYVDFDSPEAQKAAVALSESPLLGRKLLIKIGDDFAGRPAPADLALTDPALIQKTHSKTAQKILRAQKQPPAPTLFFGNLGFETTEESIRGLLDAHRPVVKKGKKGGKKGKGGSDSDRDSEDRDGDEKKDEDGEKSEGEDEEMEKEKKGKGKKAIETVGPDAWIRKIRMGTFEDTGKCKGFAFVDFVSIEHATACLINPQNHRLNGRQLVVEYAGADAVRRGAPKGQKNSHSGGTEGGNAHNGSRSHGAAVAPSNAHRGPGGTGRGSRHWDGEGQRDAIEFENRKWSGGSGRDNGAARPLLPRGRDVDARKDQQRGQGGWRAGDDGPGYGPAAKGGDGDATGRGGRRQWEGQTGESKGYEKNYSGKSRPKPGAALALAKRESAAIIPSQGKKITF